jgi:hypothetical protein
MNAAGSLKGDDVGGRVVGMRGTSPKFVQPAPLNRVMPKPLSLDSEYRYPPGPPPTVTGLNWTIPNGRSAPGNVWPFPSVPIIGSTRATGSLFAAIAPAADARQSETTIDAAAADRLRIPKARTPLEPTPRSRSWPTATFGSGIGR